MKISTIILQLQAITAWTGMGEGEKITGKKLKENTELNWSERLIQDYTKHAKFVSIN